MELSLGTSHSHTYREIPRVDDAVNYFLKTALATLIELKTHRRVAAKLVEKIGEKIITEGGDPVTHLVPPLHIPCWSPPIWLSSRHSQDEKDAR